MVIYSTQAESSLSATYSYHKSCVNSITFLHYSSYKKILKWVARVVCKQFTEYVHLASTYLVLQCRSF